MKPYTKILISAFVLSGLVAACGETPVKKPVDSLNPLSQAVNNAVIRKSANDDRTYAAVLLPNQLQVVLVSDPNLENSAASLAVAVGSAQDPEKQMGLAHYLEHMLFLGTVKYPEPDGFMKYTQENGGMTNAFTAFDKTNYMFQINATKFNDALDRFSDYFKQPTFDPLHADKERNAVNNEWSLQKAQDNWNLMALDGVIGNPNNPRHKFNIGNLETLSDKPGSSLNAELKAFYQKYYSANTMRLTLVGKQSIPELKALAEKHFGSIPNKNLAVPEIKIQGITANDVAKEIFYKPIKDLKALYVDFPLTDNKTQWRLKPNEYVNNLITSEELGTLCEQLRKKGYTVNTTAHFNTDSYGPDGYVRITSELTDLGLKHQDEIVAAVFAYIDLIKKQGLNQNYFKELQAMRAKDFDNATKQQPLQQAVELALAQFDYPLEHLLDNEYVYERYDEKAIQSVLDQLDVNKVRVWHINSGETVAEKVPYFEGQYAVKAISAQQLDKWKVMSKSLTFNLPPLNNLFTDKPADIVDNKYLKPHVVLSQPGVEAFLQHPEFYREDKGQITLEINTNFSQKNAKNAALSSLLTEVFKKQNVTLMDRAERASLGVTITNGGASSTTINLSGYTTKHPLLVNELLTGFKTLKIDEKIFSEAMVSYKQALENANKDHVFRQAMGHLGRLTNKGAYSRPELLAAAKTITQKDLIRYHQMVLREPLLRILAAGNYTEAQVTTMAKDASAILPSQRLPNARQISRYATPMVGQHRDYQESVNLADSAVVQAWFRPTKSDDEQAQLVVLNALYANAFFMQLRTSEQLGYVVSSAPYPVDEVPGFVMVVQSSNSDLTKIKSRMDSFRKEYLATLKLMNPEDVVRARESVLANVLQKPTSFYQEAGLYSSEFMNAKYSFDGRDRFIAALKRVKYEDVVKLYESMLLNHQSGEFTIQMRGTNFKDSIFAK